MKNLIKLLALSLLTITSVGCDEAEIVQLSDREVIEKEDYQEFVYPHAKGYDSTYTRGGDNSFGENWENFNEITDALGGTIYTPWSGEGVGAFNHTLGHDVKKEDGWTMVFHTANVTGHNTDRDYIIMLYNQKSGDLKLFYYRAGDITIPHSTGIWSFSFPGKQGLVNALNEVALPSSVQFNALENYTWESTMMGVNDKIAFQQGWNVIEIPGLAYDPNADKTLPLKYHTYGINEFIHNLLGKSESVIEGTIITDSSTDPFSDMTSTISNYSGEAATDLVKKIVKKDNKFTAALAGGVGALVKTGVNKLLGCFFGSFSEPTPVIQTVRLTGKTETTVTGTSFSTVQSGIFDKELQIGSETTGLELGTWNLKENPTVYIHPLGVLNSLPRGEESDENEYIFRCTDKYKAEVVFNPQLLPHIKKYWVEYTPVVYGNIYNVPKALKTDSDYGSIGYAGTYFKGTKYVKDTSELLYQDTNNGIYENKLKAVATFWQIWNKHGKDKDDPIYKYIYAPDNGELIRGGVKFLLNATECSVKVSVFMVTEFENKIDTTVNTRSFIPKFEWDPEIMEKLKGRTLKEMQYICYTDPILATIDKRVKEKYYMSK